jgi:hypothetical protein
MKVLGHSSVNMALVYTQIHANEQVGGCSTHDSRVLGSSYHGRRPCIGIAGAGRQPVQPANGTACPRGLSLESADRDVEPDRSQPRCDCLSR